MKENYQDSIDKYVLGQMIDDEKSAFEQMMLKDPDLKMQMAFTKDMITALKSREEKLAKMDFWEEEEETHQTLCAGDRFNLTEVKYKSLRQSSAFNKLRKESRISLIPFKPLILWISGIAAVFVAGFFLIDSFNDQELYKNQKGMPSVISENDHILYIKKNYLIMDISSLKGGGDHVEIVWMIESGELDEALNRIEREKMKIAFEQKALEAISDKERRAYEQKSIQLKSDELDWLKVYALIAKGQREEVMQLLDSLRNSDGVYKERADSLYLIITKN